TERRDRRVAIGDEQLGESGTGSNVPQVDTVVIPRGGQERSVRTEGNTSRSSSLGWIGCLDGLADRPALEIDQVNESARLHGEDSAIRTQGQFVGRDRFREGLAQVPPFADQQSQTLRFRESKEGAVGGNAYAVGTGFAQDGSFPLLLHIPAH